MHEKNSYISLHSYKGKSPQITKPFFQASGSHIIGDIQIKERSSVWFNAVLRADVNHIKIGSLSNIQDASVIHVTYGGNPSIIGDQVTIGHGAILHACKIDDLCLIGMGSTVLDGAHIAKYSLLAAGSLVAPGSHFPENSLIMGSPAKVKRSLTKKEIDYIHWSSEHYWKLASDYQ